MITGSTGLVGSNVINAAPPGIKLLSPTHQQLDLLNYNELLAYLVNNQPDIIIHCAGYVGGIMANSTSQFDFLNNNAIMGLNLVNAAKSANITKLINLSSSCCYPVDIPCPLREENILDGHFEKTNEGYAIAKVSIMKACEFLRKDGYEYKTIIPVNLFGEGDNYHAFNAHLIASIIRKVHYAITHNERTIEIWGTGKPKRECLYAKDLAEFIWYSVNNFDKMPYIVNCSSSKEYAISDLYSIIGDIIGYTGEFIYNHSYPDGVKSKLTDNTRMKCFGWSPKTSLEDAIRETYKSYKSDLVK
jgi:GDP-L-fucose synthase